MTSRLALEGGGRGPARNSRETTKAGKATNLRRRQREASEISESVLFEKSLSFIVSVGRIDGVVF